LVSGVWVALTRPTKRLLLLTKIYKFWHNGNTRFPLRAVAFRGQRFSFLGSKNRFLRDLQLGLRLLVPPKTLLLFPQDKEGFGSIYIARRKLICIFEESTILRSNLSV